MESSTAAEGQSRLGDPKSAGGKRKSVEGAFSNPKVDLQQQRLLVSNARSALGNYGPSQQALLPSQSQGNIKQINKEARVERDPVMVQDQ